MICLINSTHNGEAHNKWGIPWEVECYRTSKANIALIMDIVVPTDYQKSIVIGLLLGDGYLYKDGRLQVEQATKQQEYVVWLHNQLHNLAPGEISQVTRVHPKTRKESFSCRFYTKKAFTDLAFIFYITEGTNRKKLFQKI